MSQTNFAPKILAFKAGADLTTHQYKLVKFGADNDTIVLCGNAEKPFGVLMNAPNTGEIAEVAVEGGAKVKIASTMSTLGGSVASAANGVARAAVAGEWAIGIQMDAGVSGDIIPVKIDLHQLNA